MRKAAYYSMGVVLLVWTGLTLGVTLQEGPPRTLVADVTDVSPITFTIINSGGDPVVTVSGAESGNGTYLNISAIIGGPGDDTYVFDADAALGTIAITELPGGGTGTLDFSLTT